MRHSVATVLATAALMLLILPGCVSERDVSAPETEKVLSASASDVDQDNYTDIKSYVFRPIIIDADQNIIMQKSVTAAQSGTSITVSKVNGLNDSQIARLETLLFKFDSDRKDKESACRETLGFGNGGCDSPTACITTCSGPECQKYDYASELLGYWIYDYSQNEQALGNELDAVHAAIVTIADSTPDQREALMVRLNSIRSRTIAINANPLMNDNMFGICRQIDYENADLNEMLNILGTYDEKPTAFLYVVSIKFAINGKDITQLKITDTVPKPLLAALKNITMVQKDSSFDQAANITWPPLQFNLYPEYMIGYTLTSGQSMREDIFENWPTPNIRMQVVSLSNSPIIQYVIGTSGYIYMLVKGFAGYYPALSLVLAFWTIAFFLFWMAVVVAVNFFSALMARTGLRDSLVKAFGGSNPYWKEYAIASGIFFALGLGLLMGSTPVAEDTLVIDNIAKHMIESPLGAGSTVFFFLSFYTAYALLEDRFKGILAGRKYYENVLDVSPKANALRFKKLQERTEELRQKLSSTGGLDVSDEKNVLISVPLDRIETLLRKEGSERAVKELIEVYIDKVEAAIGRADEKVKISKEYWAEWSKEIAEKLGERGSVALTSFTAIPAEWRVWAANKYAMDNDAEELAVEGDYLKRAAGKAEATGEDALKKLVSRDMALGLAVLTKEGVGTVITRSGNRSLEGILSWKISNYASTLGQKVLNADYIGMVIVGSKNAVAFTRGEGREGVIFAPKDKIKAAFSEFENRLKKL